jgi:hypothetical protein
VKPKQDGPVAHAGEAEQAAKGVVGDRLDELVGDSRLAQRPERAGFGKFLGLEPVPEHLQRADVAGHTDRGEGDPELDEPGPQVRPGQAIDRVIRAECGHGPHEDHPIPGDRLRRGALCGLRPENRSTPRRSVRCSKVSGADWFGRPESGAQRSGESGAHCIESPPWRRMPAPAQTTRCCASPFDGHNRLWCWLARKDSNLRSPDPESGDRFSRFLARREHETHRFLPPILPSLVTHRKRGQVATGGSPDSSPSDHRLHARFDSGRADAQIPPSHQRDKEDRGGDRQTGQRRPAVYEEACRLGQRV